jgi:hypothetical protein
MKSAAAGLTLLAAALVSPASANDMPPDVFVRNDYVGIAMFMEGLRDIQPLAREILQESREWAKTVEAEQRSKSATPPVTVSRFGRRYVISSIVGDKRYYSILLHSSTDIDDVNIVQYTTTFLWDAKARKRVSLAGFFDETEDAGPAMTRLFEESISGLAAQVGKDRAATMTAGLHPSLNRIGQISLALSTVDGKSSGLNFHYAAPSSERPGSTEFEIFVPWTKFASHLSPHGRRIFGGQWQKRDIW